jgi:hypothetical protein
MARFDSSSPARRLLDHLGYGLAREGLTVVDRTVTPSAR